MTLYARNGSVLPKTNIQKGKPVHIRDKVCWRCGGLGGSDKWKHTGWTCYRCGGDGKDPNREIVKLYTEDQLRVLNERKAKADAKKAEARAEKARLEAIRVQQEKAEIISLNQDLIDRIGDELRHGDNEILQSVIERICVTAKEPTERQIEVVNKIIADRTAERERLARAAHVGEVGKRQDFTLTLLYTMTEQTGRFPAIYRHWSLFQDEVGRKIACTSPPWVIGLSKADDGYGDLVYTKGQTIRVKATVKDHRYDKRGEPVTYINRPKEL